MREHALQPGHILTGPLFSEPSMASALRQILQDLGLEERLRIEQDEGV
jgi:hypothetical protein